MTDLKTVEGSVSCVHDPISTRQAEGVARMRASLLACSEPELIPVSLRQITTQRVIHQVARIIRYIEMMDKIENALYRSIDRTLDEIDDSPAPIAMATMLTLQERLQTNMINSHKLLEPYLTLVDEVELVPEETGPTSSVYDRPTRDKIRSAAQLLLAELGGDSTSD